MLDAGWMKYGLVVCAATLGGCDVGAGDDLFEGGAGRSQGGVAGVAPTGQSGGGSRASGGTSGAPGAAGSSSLGGSAGSAGLGGGGSSGNAGTAGISGSAGAAGRTQVGPAYLVNFEPPPGGFEDEISVQLAANDPEAEVHYTLDGSTPSLDSPIYEEPIPLAESARIRAVAFLPDHEEGDPLPVYGATYLRVAEDAATFRSHLPVVVVHTFGSGKLDSQGTDHVPASISIFEPASGSTSLVGRASLDSAIGIHVRGQSSRAYPKLQYAVELRGDTSDADRALPVLGMPAESDWVLSDSVNFDRALFRNALAFAISNRIGRYASRTRFAEAFLVDEGGDVTRSRYIGFYTVVEKIKRDTERVNVEKLEQLAQREPAISGGYILSIDKGDNDFEAGGRSFQFVYPEPEAMAEEARIPQLEYIRGYIDDLGEALSSPDFIGSSHGKPYSDFLDVDAFIDHNIVNALAKNVDGLRISTYFHKDVSRPLAAGPVWDFDRAFGTPHDHRASDPEGWKEEGSDATHYLEQGFWGLLFKDPAFKARYKQRFLELLDDELAPDALDDVIDGFVSEVGEAQLRNFERWGDFRPDGGYDNEVAVIKDFLRRRAEWLESELSSWE